MMLAKFSATPATNVNVARISTACEAAPIVRPILFFILFSLPSMNTVQAPGPIHFVGTPFGAIQIMRSLPAASLQLERQEAAKALASAFGLPGQSESPLPDFCSTLPVHHST